MIWIGRVITGWYNYLFHKTSEQAKERIKICESCEFRQKLGKAYICSQCGCFLPQKNLVPEEHCSIGKW